MTVRQAAETLGVSVATIYGLCALGRIRCSRVGLGRGVIRISEAALAEYLGDKGEEGALRPAPPSPRPRPKFKFRHLRLKPS